MLGPRVTQGSWCTGGPCENSLSHLWWGSLGWVLKVEEEPGRCLVRRQSSGAEHSLVEALGGDPRGQHIQTVPSHQARGRAVDVVMQGRQEAGAGGAGEAGGQGQATALVVGKATVVQALGWP